VNAGAPGQDEWLRSLREAVLYLRGATIFTAMGRYGCTLEDIVEKDEIVFVREPFYHPVVLRKTEREEAQGEEFKLVGFASFDGVMNNEFEDKQLIQEILQLEIRTIDIS